jgi:acetyl-CoA acyltransferase
MASNKEAVIVAYGRSPVCKAIKGSLVNTHPVEYTAQTLMGVLNKVPQLHPDDIEDVVLGCAQPINELNMNIGRLIPQRAGLPDSISGQTINRFCASGLQTIAICSNAIAAGQGDVMIAGGVEDMSKTFFPIEEKFKNQWLAEHIPGTYMSNGQTAENVAELYKVTREEMDRMAVESHAKAAAAQKSGDLATSIVPITVTDADGNEKVIVADEGIREGTNLETLATLRPCFVEDGLVTAATSSQMSDAAAFAVMMSAEKAASLNIKPIARLIGHAVAGCPSEIFGVGPIYAVPKVMQQTGLTVDDMDVIELNEAFAAQAIPCINELKLDKKKVNPYGGAMALGHPMGATGIFLTCKALDFLRKENGRYALVTMCIGGGMGAAGIFEMID